MASLSVLFLGGPLHHTHQAVPDSLPAEILTEDPYITPRKGFRPPVTLYKLRTRTAGRLKGYVYVTADYETPSQIPMVNEQLAATYRDHGLREGVHFTVQRHAHGIDCCWDCFDGRPAHPAGDNDPACQHRADGNGRCTYNPEAR